MVWGSKDISSILTEVQNQILTVHLPEEVLNKPRVRVWETSKKAIIDVAIYNKAKPILDVQSRIELQNIVRSLKSNLLVLPEVFELRRDGYLIHC